MSTDRDKYEDYWSATSPQVVSKKRQLLASEQSLFSQLWRIRQTAGLMNGDA